MYIKKFDEKITTKDHLFYTPAVSGPQGKIPFSGQNYGHDNSIKSFKEFDGEYRKGSKKYGSLLNSIMEFLRLPEFKNKISENDGIKFEILDFEKRSNINVNNIKLMLDDENNLFSFDIKIDDKYIIFSNIKNTYKNRYVSGR